MPDGAGTPAEVQRVRRGVETMNPQEKRVAGLRRDPLTHTRRDKVTNIVLGGLAMSAVVLGLSAIAVTHQGEDGAFAATPTPQVTPWEGRFLACEEDEDIVITLDERNLPVAFCDQWIER